MRNLITLMVFLVFASAAQAQDRYFDSAGVQIRYVEKGSGEPLVLVHGYTSNLEVAWVETGVLDSLARNFRVIAFDLRGHGKSGKPHSPQAYGVQLGEDVVRLLDHLKIPRAHIVGYSLGAATTAKLLATRPERFLTAVLGGGRWVEQLH